MGRFDSLKSESSEKSNPFKNGGNQNRRRGEGGRGFNSGFSKKKNSRFDMDPVDTGKKKGKYLPPGARKRLEENTSKPLFVTEPKFVEKEGDFPGLADANNDAFPELGKVENKETKEEIPATKKPAWSAIVTNKDESEKPPPPELEPVQPGWIRLRLDKKTRRTIIERGPTTKEHTEFMEKWDRWDKEQKKREWDARMKRYERENEFRYPYDNYIYGWEYDDAKHHEEWLRRLEEDDGIVRTPPQSESDDDYYSDEY